MTRNFVLALTCLGCLAGPALAQGRRDSQGIPPGQMPRPGECRVWYDGRPPGQQPRSMNCRDAERIAARDPGARVIYGSGTAIPRQYPRYPESQYPGGGVNYPNGRQVYRDVAFDNGYQDGYDKGRDDAQDNNRYDPARQGRYKSADHGYDRRYGSKAEYQRMYRDGFRDGYSEAYRDYDYNRRSGSGRSNSGLRIPWPF